MSLRPAKSFNGLPGPPVVRFNACLAEPFRCFGRAHTACATRDDDLVLFLERVDVVLQALERDVFTLRSMPGAEFTRCANIYHKGPFGQKVLNRRAFARKDGPKEAEHGIASVVHHGLSGILPTGDARFKFHDVGEAHFLQGVGCILRTVAATAIEQDESVFVIG